MLDRPEIERIWCEAAGQLGFTVARTDAAYATSDGHGTISIGARATLDEDDSLAQLVFHELCHALVQGEGNLRVPDWGLDNTNQDDVPRENACLRVQAHLAQSFGLRAVMRPTTVTRPYYEALPAHALADTDEAAALARAALSSALATRFVPVLEQALADTSVALLADVDCQTCAACCREGFASVGIAMRDPVTWLHPELVVRAGPRFSLARHEGRCAALDARSSSGWSCRIYDDRPQPCRELARGSAKCLAARERVGLGFGS